MHVRLRVAAQALNAGYNVLLSDADAVFISPVPFFSLHKLARLFIAQSHVFHRVTVTSRCFLNAVAATTPIKLISLLCRYCRWCMPQFFQAMTTHSDKMMKSQSALATSGEEEVDGLWIWSFALMRPTVEVPTA